MQNRDKLLVCYFPKTWSNKKKIGSGKWESVCQQEDYASEEMVPDSMSADIYIF